MERSIIIAGFGGQGVILAGKILAQAAMDHGLEVTWLPSYGPEMRGGTANCTVVVSNAPVGSPIVDEPTGLIAMNRPSLDKFEPIVATGGAIVVNESLVDRKATRRDIDVRYVPFNEIALRIGNARTINMVALGAYVGVTDAVPLSVVVAAMTRSMDESGKSKLVDVNVSALQEGYDAVR
jgi:2-oxoglutarate ferredoxin oxidoreductase subunit gamma